MSAEPITSTYRVVVPYEEDPQAPNEMVDFHWKLPRAQLTRAPERGKEFLLCRRRRYFLPNDYYYFYCNLFIPWLDGRRRFGAENCVGLSFLRGGGTPRCPVLLLAAVHFFTYRITNSNNALHTHIAWHVSQCKSYPPWGHPPPPCLLYTATKTGISRHRLVVEEDRCKTYWAFSLLTAGFIKVIVPRMHEY